MLDAHLMDVLRTAVSALASHFFDANVATENAFHMHGFHLTSKIPKVIAIHEALRNYRAPAEANQNLGM